MNSYRCEFCGDGGDTRECLCNIVLLSAAPFYLSRFSPPCEKSPGKKLKSREGKSRAWSMARILFSSLAPFFPPRKTRSSLEVE